MAILFWFYKNPEIVRDRLLAIRRMNPDVLIFGLYCGPHADVDLFYPVTSQLDDVWLHPEVSVSWAWQNGDLILAHWYLERGIRLRWSTIFIHQWDLLLACPVDHFHISEDNEIMLPGVRPLAEVASHWIWVQPWSHYYPEFRAFCAHPLLAERTLSACIFIFATVSRRFLRDYAATALDVPGFVEYRLPTIAHAMGYQLRSGGLYPDWGDSGNPLLNGRQHAVTKDQIQESYRIAGDLAWHPVYDPISLDEVFFHTPISHVVPGGTNVAILQITPARPGIVAGGSQAVADALARRLERQNCEVFVFAGTNDELPVSWISDKVHYRSAFRITDELLRGTGHVQFFSGEISVLLKCRVAFMFDRVFPLPESVRAILFLGTVAYPFARTAALSQGWDHMIVPSDFVHREVTSLLTSNEQRERVKDVTVIPNPIDPAALGLHGPACYRTQSNNRVRLLFPHRGDSGKGVEASLRLLSHLRRSVDVKLTVVVDLSPTAEPGFYTSLVDMARFMGVLEQIELLPWVPRNEMRSIYESADLTLCLGRMSEGFGLVCLESILCGTPALAQDTGAQTHLLPPGHGCFVAPEDEDEMAKLAIDIIRDSSLHSQLRLGSEIIRQKFSIDAFIERVRDTVGHILEM